MKYLLSALAAVMLFGVLTATPAEARCWWNGWGWVCGPGWGYYHRPYYRPWWGYHRHWYWWHGHHYWR